MLIIFEYRQHFNDSFLWLGFGRIRALFNKNLFNVMLVTTYYADCYVRACVVVTSIVSVCRMTRLANTSGRLGQVSDCDSFIVQFEYFE